MRTMTIAAISLVLVAAFALLGIEHATRELERGIGERRAGLASLEDTVTRLEVEYTRLAAPARIQVLARALGLGPLPAVAIASRGSSPAPDRRLSATIVPNAHGR